MLHQRTAVKVAVNKFRTNELCFSINFGNRDKSFIRQEIKMVFVCALIFMACF